MECAISLLISERILYHSVHFICTYFILQTCSLRSVYYISPNRWKDSLQSVHCSYILVVVFNRYISVHWRPIRITTPMSVIATALISGSTIVPVCIYKPWCLRFLMTIATTAYITSFQARAITIAAPALTAVWVSLCIASLNVSICYLVLKRYY